LGATNSLNASAQYNEYNKKFGFGELIQRKTFIIIIVNCFLTTLCDCHSVWTHNLTEKDKHVFDFIAFFGFVTINITTNSIIIQLSTHNEKVQTTHTSDSIVCSLIVQYFDITLSMKQVIISVW